MDAPGPIHELRDAEIDRHARQHVRLVGAQLFLGGQEIDRLAGGELGGQRQIFVQAHDDIVSGRFGPRPTQMQVFANHELKRAA